MNPIEEERHLFNVIAARAGFQGMRAASQYFSQGSRPWSVLSGSAQQFGMKRVDSKTFTLPPGKPITINRQSPKIMALEESKLKGGFERADRELAHLQEKEPNVFKIYQTTSIQPRQGEYKGRSIGLAGYFYTAPYQHYTNPMSQIIRKHFVSDLARSAEGKPLRHFTTLSAFQFGLQAYRDNLNTVAQGLAEIFCALPPLPPRGLWEKLRHPETFEACLRQILQHVRKEQKALSELVLAPRSFHQPSR